VEMGLTRLKGKWGPRIYGFYIENFTHFNPSYASNRAYFKRIKTSINNME